MIDRKVILMLFLTTLFFLFLAFAFDLFVLSLCLNVFQWVKSSSVFLTVFCEIQSLGNRYNW